MKIKRKNIIIFSVIFVSILIIIYFVFEKQESCSEYNECPPSNEEIEKLLKPQREVIQQAEEYKPEGVCAQVITPAYHEMTGAEFEFPTSCLPSGWSPKD